MEVEGKAVQFGHPADAIRAGLVYVPGDRTDALLMQRSVKENIALPFSARVRAWGPLDKSLERTRVDGAIERLQIDTRAQSEVQRLSGGNQQKVTIARWIATGARTILCFDPTRGIDIRTKREIYRLLRELAAQGASILLYTSELEEVQLVCDRAIVIFAGRVVDTLPADIADEAALTRAAYGLPREARRPGECAAKSRRRRVSAATALIRIVRRNGWVSGLFVLLGLLLVVTRLIQPDYGAIGHRIARARRPALRIRGGGPDRRGHRRRRRPLHRLDDGASPASPRRS